MFNLDQSIAEWRRQMAVGGIKSRDVLDELESHLREDVEQQVASGATAKQAFCEAVTRMGSAEEVRGEFAKMVTPPVPFSPKLLRACCAGMALFVFLIETWTLLAFEMTLAERVLGMTFVLLVAGYIGALPYLNRALFPGVRGMALRNVLGAVCNWG
ncbi:MAG TPA: permease prefix domain 1-containing protein, partial [Verrucomicrobiae bacterium]